MKQQRCWMICMHRSQSILYSFTTTGSKAIGSCYIAMESDHLFLIAPLHIRKWRFIFLELNDEHYETKTSDTPAGYTGCTIKLLAVCSRRSDTLQSLCLLRWAIRRLNTRSMCKQWLVTQLCGGTGRLWDATYYWSLFYIPTFCSLFALHWPFGRK